MKPSAFDYVRASSVEEALTHLSELGDRAKLIAGGQTLMATLNMRLSSPDLLIDISRIPSLSGIRLNDSTVTIGALTTHREIERSPLIAKHLPLLAQAAPQIAHAAIRNSGTIGGSVAFADPAAEWPACCVALDATIVIRSAAGERRVRAREFFHNLYETDLTSTDILTAIELPVTPPTRRSVFLELSRRRGDYAIVGVALLARLGEGKLHDVALAFVGAGPVPLLAQRAMAALEGRAPEATVLQAARAALAHDLQPGSDLYTSAATRLHLAGVLLERAVTQLTSGGATPHGIA
jgi:carbon-monoxide dehydrogenase medium subunit